MHTLYKLLVTAIFIITAVQMLFTDDNINIVILMTPRRY